MIILASKNLTSPSQLALLGTCPISAGLTQSFLVLYISGRQIMNVSLAEGLTAVVSVSVRAHRQMDSRQETGGEGE